MRILLLRGGALGDFIVTLPALRLLRTRWPDAHIALAGNATAAALALHEGLIDAAHSQHEARWARLHTSPPLPADFGQWLAAFDTVINFWPDPDNSISLHFPRNAGQTFISASPLPSGAPPAARHYCDSLQPLGLATDNVSYHLKFTGAATRAPTIALHPGSGSPQKNWPLTRWRTLCTQLRATAPLLIVCGEADTAAMDALASLGEIAFAQPLPKVARRLASCHLFIGHDSGIAHLAAATDTPCLLLFGPTDPAMWAPPGPHVHILHRGPTLEAISCEDAVTAAASLLRHHRIQTPATPARPPAPPFRP